MLYIFYLLKIYDIRKDKTFTHSLLLSTNHPQTAGTGNNKLHAINSSGKEMYKTKK